MKETFILSKILLKNSLNKNLKKDKMNFKTVAKNLFLFLAIAYVACVIGMFSKEVVESLRKVNQPAVFLSICLLLTVGVSIFRSIVSSLGVLYFSKDIEYLLPLPISPLKIIFAKFNVMLVATYMTEFFTFAIPFGVYGVIMTQEPIFYIMSILTFIFLPIIPTLLGALITVVLMSFTNIFKNKDVVQYVTVFISLAIAIGLQFYITKNAEMTTFAFANKLQEIDGATKIIGKYTIILNQAITCVTELEGTQYIESMLFLIAESITAYVITGILIGTTYIKSATNITSGKSVKKLEFNKNIIEKRSIRRAYVDKEIKLLFRTPAFMLNTVVPVIVLPIILCVPFFTSLGEERLKAISSLADAISQNIENTMGLAFVLAIIILLYMFNYISVTSISREGEDAVFMKYIPVALYKQCRYKAIPGFLLNLYPLMLLVLGMKFILSVNNIFIIEVLILGLLCNVFVSYTSIIIDILNPKLHWSTEYAVVKQNMNMLWDLIYMFIMGLIIFIICSYFTSIHAATVLLSGIFIILTAMYDKFLKQNSVNIFKKIC